jgi:hypothetical protein
MVETEAARIASEARTQGASVIADTLLGVAIHRDDCGRILLVIGRESIPLYCRILTGGSRTELAALLDDALGYGNSFCERVLRSLLRDDRQRAKQLAGGLIELAAERIRGSLLPS